MARLVKEMFDRIEKERHSVHKLTPATFTVFTADDKKYFQIDTFGSTGREMPHKISQSIQLDSEMATLLITLLKKEFGLG